MMLRTDCRKTVFRDQARHGFLSGKLKKLKNVAKKS